MALDSSDRVVEVGFRSSITALKSRDCGSREIWWNIAKRLPHLDLEDMCAVSNNLTRAFDD